MEMVIHLKYKGRSNNSHEKFVLRHSNENILFLGFPSIEFIEYL